jgi:hypothetical protein
MAIAHTIEQSKIVLVPTEPVVRKDLADLQAKLEKDANAKDDLVVEWRPATKPPADSDWQHWARHYDTLAWQVSSIFTAASAILVGGYVNVRINAPYEARICATLAVAGIGLILFQMFIVGAFRTYRYELYEEERKRDDRSRALDTFRKNTGGPWAIYCCVAGVATVPWSFALAKFVQNQAALLWTVVISVPTVAVLVLIWHWAKPPVYS